MIKEIFFIRHGQTDYNLNKIVQGSGIDSELNETGLKQAKLFYEFYKDEGFDLVITSNLKRTHQSVQAFIESGLPHEQTNLIDEINWGIHEGKKGDPQMRQNYLNLMDHWANNRMQFGVEGGETGEQLVNRCSQFLDTLPKKNADKILVCTHGRTLRCLMMLIKSGIPKDMETFDHANTGLYLTNLKNQQLEILKMNDTSHITTTDLVT